MLLLAKILKCSAVQNKNISWGIFSYLRRGRHYNKHPILTEICEEDTITTPLYRWRNWDSGSFGNSLRTYLGGGRAGVSTQAVGIPIFPGCWGQPAQEMPIRPVHTVRPAREAAQLELESHLEGWAEIHFQMSIIKVTVSPLRPHGLRRPNKTSLWKGGRKAYGSIYYTVQRKTTCQPCGWPFLALFTLALYFSIRHSLKGLTLPCELSSLALSKLPILLLNLVC